MKWWNSYRHYHRVLSRIHRRASYHHLALVTLAVFLCFLVPDTSATAVHMDDPAPLSGIPILRGDHQPRDGEGVVERGNSG